jgi:AcrR family transcriptional regulator
LTRHISRTAPARYDAGTSIRKTSASARAETATATPPPSADRRLHAGRTYEERRAERRQALLDTALELFGTRGYRNVTIEEICRVSHVTTRYFYEEFASRDDLLLALYDDLMASMIPATRAAPVEIGGDHARLGRERVAAVLHLLLDDPRVARIVYLETIGVSDALEDRRREWHRGFADLIAAKARLFDPEASPERLRLRGLGAIGIIDEVIVDHLMSAERPDIETLVDGVHEMLEALGVDLLFTERPQGYAGSPDAPPVSPRPTRRSRKPS